MSKAATAELQDKILTALQALAPATDAVSITPSDTIDLAQEATSIACSGTGGAVKLRTAAGNDRTISIATGQTIGIRFRRVFLNGTSATGLIALMNAAALAAVPAPSPSPSPSPSVTPSPTPTPSPSLSLSSAVVKAEGNSGTSAMVWTLTLNRDGSTASYPFTWVITGSGANPANAADFGGTMPSGSGTFAPGETTKTITVLATGDTAFEPDETFTLTVTANGLNTVTSTGTISNDDSSAPTLSLSSAVTQVEGNAGSATFTWTLTLNRDGSTASYPFAWAVTGSGTNAANAADFGGTFPSGSGTFAPGETTKTITVLVAGDTAVEPDEAFTLTVTANGLNTVTSTGTISNDDVAPSTGLISDVQVMANLLDISTVTKAPVTVGDAVALYTMGWVLKVTTSSATSIDPTKVVVNIDRPGWDNKVAVTRRDTAVGTGILRRAAPNDSSPLPAGTNSFYITLDNQIFGPDIVASVTFLPGFYSSSPSIDYPGGSVTRNDSLSGGFPYPQPVVRYAALPFQVSSTSTPTVAIDVTGTSNFARSGRQFDTVEAWCRVGGVDGPAVSTQTMQRSRHTPASGRLPGKPLPAYLLDPSAASLADGVGGVRVRVYPFCGPVWESWVSGTAFPTANVEAELPFIRDAAGKYSPVYAWVNQDFTATTTATASASGVTLTVTAQAGTAIGIGTVLFCGTAKRTVTALGTGTGGTGTYTTSESGNVVSTQWTTGTVQTTASDPGASASFSYPGAAAYAIQAYNNARTGGTAHNDTDGGVIMLRDVAGSTLGAAAGSYSSRGAAFVASIAGGAVVPLEIRAASGATSQLCRWRGTMADGASIASNNKQVSGRVVFRNITIDSSGISTASDNIVMDGGGGGVAVTKAAQTSHVHFIDCDIVEHTGSSSSVPAIYRMGWRNDFRVAHSVFWSSNSAGYTATYQTFVRAIGSAYSAPSYFGGVVMPFLGGCTLSNIGLAAQQRIALADGGEIIDGYMFINTRVDAAGNASAVVNLDTILPLTLGYSMLNFFVRQAGGPNQPAIRLGGDATTGTITNGLLHHVASDGGYGTGNAASGANARWNIDYNDQTLSAVIKYCQKIGCVIPSLNNKTDTFPASESMPTAAFTAGTRYFKDEIVNDGNATTSARLYYVYVGAANRVAVAGDLGDTTLWKPLGTLFGTTHGQNPIRTGNWRVRNAVGDAGNVVATSADGQLAIPLPTNGFVQEKLGRNSLLAIDYSTYYKSPTGGTGFTVSQLGDYRPKSIAAGDAVDSPLLGRMPAGMAVSPFDLDGTPRRNDGTGAAGPYERAA